MVFCGLYPIDGDEFPSLREALEKLRLNDSQLHLRARDLRRPGLRVPLRVPRAAAHGDHPRAARARVRPRRSSPPPRRCSTSCTRPTATMVTIDNPSELPPATEVEDIEEPFLTATILTPTDYTGTLMELCQSRRGEMTKIEYLSPERMELVYRAAAGRGRHRLLRPAQEPHPGLRQPRLRAGRLPALEPGEGRHPAQRRARRRLLA